MKNRSIVTWVLLLPIFFTALFYACSSSNTVTATPETGTTINPGEQIVIAFTGSMDPDSLALSGTMALDSNEGTWSETEKENDTLTLAPNVAWNTGTLIIDVNDAGGKAIDTVTLDYMVEIVLSKFQAADVVIGQENFQDQNANTTASTLNSPYANPGFYQGKLFLPDYSNYRVLVYNSIPTANGEAANKVVGQTSLTAAVSGDAADEMAGPVSVQAYKDKLFVLEYDNNRLVIYNTVPSTNAPTANVVIGQAGFNMAGNTCAAVGLDSPESFYIADDKLIIADSGNNRILIWNSIPTENGESPDLVLGQNSFNTCSSNDNNQDDSTDANPTSRTLDFPTGVWSDGKKLVIGDEGNNRVLIWNTFPTEKFARADIVLGQEDFTHNAANDDNQDGSSDSNASSRTLNDPYVGITSNGTQLFVVDSSNNRVLIWNEFPTENFARADVVLGQNNFSNTEYDDPDQDGSNNGNASAKTFDYPAGILLVGNQLIVTDEANSRYLIFNGE